MVGDALLHILDSERVSYLQTYLLDYRYLSLFTSLALPVTEIYRLYRGRAVAENRVKELKYDFEMDAFNLS
jgi:hypothetical protein